MKLLTFNITHPETTHLENRYEFAEGKYLEWSYRFPKLLSQVVDLKADVICLQEVCAMTVDEWITPLKELGYKYVMQMNDKNYKKIQNYLINPVGKKPHSMMCMTFYKPDITGELVKKDIRSRSLTCQFEKTTITNLHLDAKDTSMHKKHIDNLIKNNPNIICGDFNSLLNSETYNYMTENGYTDIYNALNKYPDETFITPTRRHILDFIWFKNCVPVDVEWLKIEKNVLIPNKTHCSDHIYILSNLQV